VVLRRSTAVVHRVEFRRQGDDQEQGDREKWQGHLVQWSATLVVAVADADGTERATHRIQYGARCGSMKAIWSSAASASPNGIRITARLTEVEGTMGSRTWSKPVDLGDARRIHRYRARRHRLAYVAGRRDLRPAIVIKGKDGKILKLARGGEARYMRRSTPFCRSMSRQGQDRDILARISTESAKTRDITGGLPRVAELFEARKPKDAAIIAEIAGTIRFGRDYKNKPVSRSSRWTKRGDSRVPDSEGQAHPSADGDIVEKGDFIVEGNPAPHDILAIKGIEELAAYLSTKSRRSTGCRAC